MLNRSSHLIKTGLNLINEIENAEHRSQIKTVLVSAAGGALVGAGVANALAGPTIALKGAAVGGCVGAAAALIIVLQRDRSQGSTLTELDRLLATHGLQARIRRA